MDARWIAIPLLVAVVPCAEAYQRRQKSRADRIKTPAASYDAAAIDNAANPGIKQGDKGSGVVRAQILLSRAHFSPGEIDGRFGSNLRKAVSAYQDNRKLPVTGSIDSATWAALNQDTAPALTNYTVTPEDVAGPFLQIPAKIQDQAGLPALGYTTPLEALSEKFHASPALMQALNPAANFGAAGQALVVPNAIAMPPGPAARIEVSQSESSIRAYDAANKLLAWYPITAGSERDPLPLGEWKIKGVARNPPFHYNPKLFWDASEGDAKTTIKPGPNNPVGPVWIDLSKEHTGIHGTPEPSQVGHVQSHGCIRLTNWDALELASMVKPGTPATLKE